MDIVLLSVPYDTARRGERMGAGPEHLLNSGAVDRLRADGHSVRVERVDVPDGAFRAEISTAFALQRGVAAGVRRALAAGSFPIVLAGNCNAAALGALGGLRRAGTGVLWFDSHGDFNTPETTVGGFLDGMALAMATGRCWRQLLAQLPGFEPVDERNVVLLGTRDLDPLERALLAESGVTLMRPADVRRGVASALDPLRSRARDLYLHVDLDVLDPVGEGRANALAAPGGLTLDEVAGTIRLAARDFRVRAAALTAYDPTFDADGRVCRAALALLSTLAAAAAVEAHSPHTTEAE